MSDKAKNPEEAGLAIRVLCLLLEACIVGLTAWLFFHMNEAFEPTYRVLEPYVTIKGALAWTPASVALAVADMLVLVLGVKTLVEAIVSTAIVCRTVGEHISTLVTGVLAAAVVNACSMVLPVLFVSLPFGALAAAALFILLYLVIPDGKAWSLVPAFRNDEKAALVLDGVASGERVVEVHSADELREVMRGIGMLDESARMDGERSVPEPKPATIENADGKED